MRELTTERLRLRPFTDADEGFTLELHRHPQLVRFIPSAVCHSLADAHERIERFRQYDADPVLGVPAVTLLDGTPVGLILLKPIPPSGLGRGPLPRPAPGEQWDIEIGWRVHPAHEGRGYITEAARAVLAHAHAGGLRRVVAVTDSANQASQRVAERLRMRRVGPTTAYYDEELTLFVSASEGPPDG